MAKTLGYMITLTTYGTWLQGDKRGYVKKGKIKPHNKKLLELNKNALIQNTVRLTKNQRQLIQEAIARQAKLLGQNIYALAVLLNHVHIVAEYIPQPISKIVAHYKKAARLALKETGHNGKLWTRGYDKRFCFDQATLEQRIKYVQNHNSR